MNCLIVSLKWNIILYIYRKTMKKRKIFTILLLISFEFKWTLLLMWWLSDESGGGGSIWLNCIDLIGVDIETGLIVVIVTKIYFLIYFIIFLNIYGKKIKSIHLGLIEEKKCGINQMNSEIDKYWW